MDKTKLPKPEIIRNCRHLHSFPSELYTWAIKPLEISAHEEWRRHGTAIFLSGISYLFPLIVCIVAYFFFSERIKEKRRKNNKDPFKNGLYFLFQYHRFYRLAPCALMTSACSISGRLRGTGNETTIPEIIKKQLAC